MKDVYVILQSSTLTYLLMEASSTPIPTTLLLKKFTFKPEASSKNLRIALMVNTFCMELFAKNKVSSANRKREISTFCSPTKYPLKTFYLLACLINLLSPSTTNKNKNGAIGSPFHSPFCALNSSIGLPLTKIEIVVDSIFHFIHLTHFSLNPNLPII